VSSYSAQLEVSNSAATLASPVVCSSDEANHESSVQWKAGAAVLPGDIADGLDDSDSDCSLDICCVSEEQFLHIHTKIAEQRNLYRRKCVQVSKLSECTKILSVLCYCCRTVILSVQQQLT